MCARWGEGEYPRSQKIVGEKSCYLQWLYKITNFLGNLIKLVKNQFSKRFSYVNPKGFSRKFQPLIDFFDQARKMLLLDFLISFWVLKIFKTPWSSRNLDLNLFVNIKKSLIIYEKFQKLQVSINLSTKFLTNSLRRGIHLTSPKNVFLIFYIFAKKSSKFSKSFEKYFH